MTERETKFHAVIYERILCVEFERETYFPASITRIVQICGNRVRYAAKTQ